MKSFFIKLIAFVIIFAFLDIAFGDVMKAINDGVQKGDYGRNNYIMSELRGKDVLIFGSSRAIHHYDPETISDSLRMSCYNCGEDGMGILLSYSRLNAILTRYRPKVIVYDIETAYDIEKDDNGKYLGKLNPFYPGYGLLTIYDDVSPIEKYKMVSHFYRYNSKIVELLIQRMSSSSELAKDATFYPLSGHLSYVPETPQTHNIEVDSIKIKYLNTFISRCVENKIQLFFMVSPSLICQDMKLSKIKEVCDQWNVPLLSHYSDTAFIAHQEFFNDPVHLNLSGTDKYNKVISSEIKKYMEEDMDI